MSFFIIIIIKDMNSHISVSNKPEGKDVC